MGEHSHADLELTCEVRLRGAGEVGSVLGGVSATSAAVPSVSAAFPLAGAVPVRGVLPGRGCAAGFSAAAVPAGVLARSPITPMVDRVSGPSTSRRSADGSALPSAGEAAAWSVMTGVRGYGHGLAVGLSAPIAEAIFVRRSGDA